MTNSTPASVSSSSNNTFLMSASPVQRRKAGSGGSENYKPKIITTVGARPACLVNASVTYVGNDQIYAFGGFDQYTDEVYNHVLRLNLQTKQWSLVDNYGDIPGVRMGHTANLWQGDKLLVYGGENEHRSYLSDVIIFDLKTAHWLQPELNGSSPRGRARHSAVIHDEKLYIIGGMTGHENYVLDDICYLDLKTWTWSRTWRFVQRYDHTSWIWGGRIWVFGGLTEARERTNEIWWLDLQGTPAFDFSHDARERQTPSKALRLTYNQTAGGHYGGSSTTYAANSSSIAANPPSIMSSRSPPVAPGAISTLKFVSGPEIPTQMLGTHFHVYSSGCLLDFVTPASVIPQCETSLTALDLDTLRWQKLAAGKDLFHPSYRWHYCTMNEDGTHAWLLGCPTEQLPNGGGTVEEFLSDVLPIDLRKLGLLGNNLTSESRMHAKMVNAVPASDNISAKGHLSGIGADLASTFNVRPEAGSNTDFIVTAEIDDSDESISSDSQSASSNGPPQLKHLSASSQPIHVHRLILQARWPHFRRLYSAQMVEFHTKKMHIPEPYSAVKAFLYYLYTDSIAPDDSQGGAPTLADVAGMLVMSNIYDMPRLRLLCVNRLGRELDVEHAAVVWERAGVAGEEWLRRRAANFCMTHWGRVVRTTAFRLLRQNALVELCEEIDAEGRVVGGDELEAVGGLGGGRYGVGGSGLGKGSVGSAASGADDDDEMDEVEERDMDIA